MLRVHYRNTRRINGITLSSDQRGRFPDLFVEVDDAIKIKEEQRTSVFLPEGDVIICEEARCRPKDPDADE